MANSKSAAKRSRQAIRRSGQNRGVRTTLRSLQKKVSGTKEKPDAAQIRRLISALDKAVKRGVIHRNAANRRKARLNALSAVTGLSQWRVITEAINCFFDGLSASDQELVDGLSERLMRAG